MSRARWYHRAVTPPLRALVPDVERVAVLRADGIGDVVQALPALEALHAAYPAAAVSLLAAPWHAELLRGRPGPWAEVVALPPYPGVHDAPGASADAPAVHAFLAAQRRVGYDLAVQLHGGGANSNPLVRALGARVSVGSRDVGAPELDRWVPYARHQHEVLRALEVVGLVGAVPVGLQPALAVTDVDRRAADEVLGGARGPGPLVALHPGARDPARRWPPERFAEVGQALARAGARVLVVGHGPADRRAAQRIAQAWPSALAPPQDLVGALSSPALVGVLERCRLVVANDSGPRHLAAAVGTATVGVFWCGNALTAAPLARERHRIAVSFAGGCAACAAPVGGCRCEGAIVEDVAVEDVLGPALELLDPAAGAAAA